MSIELLLPIVTSPPSPPGVKGTTAQKADQISFEEILQNQMTTASSAAEKLPGEKNTQESSLEKPQAVSNEKTVTEEQNIGEDRPENEPKEFEKVELSVAYPVVNPLLIETVSKPSETASTTPVSVDNPETTSAVAIKLNTTEVLQIPPQAVSNQGQEAEIAAAFAGPNTSTAEATFGVDGKSTAAFEAQKPTGMAKPNPEIAQIETKPDQQNVESADKQPQSVSTLDANTSDLTQNTSDKVERSSIAPTTDQASENKTSVNETTEQLNIGPKSDVAQKPGSQKIDHPVKVIREENGINDADPPPDIKSGQNAAPPVSGMEQISGKTTPLQFQTSEPARLAEAQTTNILQQITNQLDGMSRSGRQTLRLQLSPQDLGTIDLKVTHTQNGVSVSLMAENGSTGKLLETQVSQLRQTLMDAGVQINQLHVGVHSGSSQSNHSQAHDNHQRYDHPHSSNFINTPNTISPELNRGSSLVDYKI